MLSLFGGERYMGLISNWANENKWWVVQNNSQSLGPPTSLKQSKTDKIVLSGCYLKERIEVTEYVLFNMCSPLYLHLGNTSTELVHA